MKTLIDTVIEHKVETKVQKTIILYNDNENTFDHVMSCLTEYCGHTEIQAEQCALMAHLKGKWAIKVGSLKTLQPICEALSENNLTVEIV